MDSKKLKVHWERNLYNYLGYGVRLDILNSLLSGVLNRMVTVLRYCNNVIEIRYTFLNG